MSTYTNSSLAVARSCLRKYELRYERMLLNDGFSSEALDVGTCWHLAHECAVAGGDAAAYAAIDKTAPSPLWREKLRRLFAAHRWYWQRQPLKVVEAEAHFKIEIEGFTFEGKVDAALEDAEGRRGILDYKTTSDALDAGSGYWRKLRLDTQVGLYALAFDRPDFILYDVVKKPTIKPKSIVKIEARRMRHELENESRETVTYFEDWPKTPELEAAITAGEESHELYGARLTNDIGNRPEFYFARRPIYRSADDYESLIDDLVQQIRRLESVGGYYRNPDACHNYGECEFFSLCSNNVHPREGDLPPTGFHVRENRHPELAQPQEEES